MKVIFVIFFLVTSYTFADDVKIEPKSDFTKYSTPELRQRVWNLERAVATLQNKIEQMERNQKGSITCYIKSFGKTHMATHNSKMRAKAEVIKKCSDATSSVHCSDDAVKCEDEK